MVRVLILFSFFMVLSLQMHSQESSTIYSSNFYLVENFRNWKIEKSFVVNEYLLYCIGNKNLLINLADTAKFTKTDKGVQIIKYKRYLFRFIKKDPRPNGGFVFQYEYRNHANKYINAYYQQLISLKSNFKPEQKEDYKLAELKKGKLTNSNTEISEEQRKYIVQANAANEKKDYENALMLFSEATKINPYSYPAAYFNMALIHGILGNYYQAVYAMKQYLVIVPEAEDARKAQDKIYEWELNIIK